MGQFGMQMPGGRGKRSASMDVYAVLAFVSFLAVGVACAVMFVSAGKLGVDGSAFGIQEAGKIKLTQAK
jgi:hypothetical protein